jgi:hypothetical protein
MEPMARPAFGQKCGPKVRPLAVAVRKSGNVIHHSDKGSQGGFKRSSQRFQIGGCDENTQTGFCGSIFRKVRTSALMARRNLKPQLIRCTNLH